MDVKNRTHSCDQWRCNKTSKINWLKNKLVQSYFFGFICGKEKPINFCVWETLQKLRHSMYNGRYVAYRREMQKIWSKPYMILKPHFFYICYLALSLFLYLFWRLFCVCSFTNALQLRFTIFTFELNGKLRLEPVECNDSFLLYHRYSVFCRFSLWNICFGKKYVCIKMNGHLNSFPKLWGEKILDLQNQTLNCQRKHFYRNSFDAKY